MAFVVFGAGGVGGVIAARLSIAGEDVVAVARGEHCERMRSGGLRLETPDNTTVVKLRVADDVSTLGLSVDDVVILTMKSQDTAAALDSLASCAPSEIAVACAQNGVENERAALRRFPNVFGICVMLPATFIEPGVVQCNGTPAPGILDVGCYPSGAVSGLGDAAPAAETIAAAFRAGGFVSEARRDIMRWKYNKLLMNLGNSIEALCRPSDAGAQLRELAREEAVHCFDAAGIEYASADEEAERRGDHVRIRPIDGKRRGGGSTWQSLARGGSVETDYLNGEIVLLGRQHGIPTPANAILQRAMWAAARTAAPPQSVPAEELMAQL